MIKLVWTLYIPAAGTAALTIACIIGSTHISTRRTAAIAAAYSISEKAWDEYKNKVVEKIGAKREQTVRDEVAQDQVTRNPIGSREVIITGNGDVLCYDAITGRYFYSNVEALRRAENTLNQKILHSDYASVSDFFDLIGLPPTQYTNEIGWNSDKLLSLEFSSVLTTDEKPCLSIHYAAWPTRAYARLQ